MIEVSIPFSNKRVFGGIWYDSKSDLYNWLKENIGKGDFYQPFFEEDEMWAYEARIQAGHFKFRNKKDAMLFKLTWG
jgi:hypothetical protein